MLAWLAGHEPEVLARAAGACCCPRTRCGPRCCRAPTGRSPTAATPRRPCCGTSSPTAGRAAAVGAAGVDPALLPAVRPSRRGGRAPRRCRSREVPVVVGGADTPLALLAAGAADRRCRSTSAPARRCCGPARATAGRPTTRSVHTYADTAGGWYAMAALQNGGSAWEWVLRRPRAVVGGLVRRGRRRRRPVPGEWCSGRSSPASAVAWPGPDDRGGWTGLLRRHHPRRPGAGRGRGRGVRDPAPRSSCSTSATGSRSLLTGGAARAGIVAAAAGRRAAAGPSGRSACAARRRSGRRCWPAGGSGWTSTPSGDAGPLVEPCTDPALEAAFDRWSTA